MQNSDIGLVGCNQTGDFAGNAFSSHEIISANLLRIGITQEERYQLILHEAYRHAGRKGFHHVITFQDWLEAEAHVDEMIDKMAAEATVNY